MREMKTAQILALERYPQPHLPAQGQAVMQQIGDGERKTLFIWLRLCQREGDAQGGLVLRAGLQLARRGWEAAGCIPRREESEQSRDQHLHPGSDGATPGLPESQKAGGKWDLSSASPRHKTLAVTTSNLDTMKTVSVAKEREGKQEQGRGNSPSPTHPHSVTRLPATSSSRRPQCTERRDTHGLWQQSRL